MRKIMRKISMRLNLSAVVPPRTNCVPVARETIPRSSIDRGHLVLGVSEVHRDVDRTDQLGAVALVHDTKKAVL